jgi:hypothetical protein
MLISHKYRFVYLKTVKTAGTSIEIYFESYCVDPEHYPGPSHARDALVSAEGIIGYRGPDGARQLWYNHMPAAVLRDRLGDETWTSYLKFCAIRNPYDKAVSHFWFLLPTEKRAEFRTADFSVVRASFSEWAATHSFPIDRDIFMIGDDVVVDEFIRYEQLHSDMERICNRLGIPWRIERMGRYKSEYRESKEHFAEYYDPQSEALVRSAYSWELAHFSYRCEA